MKLKTMAVVSLASFVSVQAYGSDRYSGVTVGLGARSQSSGGPALVADAVHTGKYAEVKHNPLVFHLSVFSGKSFSESWGVEGEFGIAGNSLEAEGTANVGGRTQTFSSMKGNQLRAFVLVNARAQRQITDQSGVYGVAGVGGALVRDSYDKQTVYGITLDAHENGDIKGGGVLQIGTGVVFGKRRQFHLGFHWMRTKTSKHMSSDAYYLRWAYMLSPQLL